MAITLTEELVLLCEGQADKAFFTTLLRERSAMPKFNIPFPESRAELEDGREPLGGRDNFGVMLRAIRVPLGFRNVKGVLIVADSADNPEKTFELICDQIKMAPGYEVPGALCELSERTDTSPHVGVMTIPDESNPGGIETVYAREILETRDWLAGCIKSFLSCGEIHALDWPPEKADKARFHSMVAAIYESDPSRAASMIWKRRGATLLMDINAQCFDSIEQRLRSFASQVG
ncbi:MAG TPA: DUF3226 domain-containing protein [Xanthobacteraceae bacterium]|nr:DUF3226 domain-containing protein [Xanthobacteraceae bacterium]